MLKQYQCIVGPDLSPYDNMPITVQKYNIFRNLAVTFFLAKNGIKIIPNVRLGNDLTLSSLDAYPKHTTIAIGTHGFTWKLSNRYIFERQIEQVIEKLEPTDILIYGPAQLDVFKRGISRGIKIHQFDSYTMKQNSLDKKRKEAVENER
mgnify:CR=1 FL=1